MKILGILLICTSCSLCGFVIDRWKKQRLNELQKWIDAFERLKGEIEYRMTPLYESSILIANFAPDNIKKVFLDFAKMLKEKESTDLYQMWQRAIHKNEGLFHLNEEDYKLIGEFARKYDGADKSMHQKSLSHIIERLRYELDKEQKEYQKTSKLNRYLGVLIGICISIFLI